MPVFTVYLHCHGNNSHKVFPDPVSALTTAAWYPPSSRGARHCMETHTQGVHKFFVGGAHSIIKQRGSEGKSLEYRLGQLINWYQVTISNFPSYTAVSDSAEHMHRKPEALAPYGHKELTLSLSWWTRVPSRSQSAY